MLQRSSATPPARSILDALMDGEARPAGELARRAGVAPSTASEHLTRLVEGRLLVVEPRGPRAPLPAGVGRGRGRARSALLPRLGGAGHLAPRSRPNRGAARCADVLRPPGRTVRSRGHGSTRRARRAAEPRRVVRADAPTARCFLVRLGVDVAGARARKRVFARACLDWSERRPHLAGALGAVLADAALDQGWVWRRPNDRGLRVTPKGAAQLRELVR